MDRHLRKLPTIERRLKELKHEIEDVADKERHAHKTDGDAKKRASVVDALDDALASLNEAVQHIEEARQ